MDRMRFLPTILILLLLLGLTGLGRLPAMSADSHLVLLTDEPGNWFKNSETGTSLTVVNAGDRVQFDRGSQTGTDHTVTLLLRPPNSTLEVDQDQAGNGKVNATFDRPGVYLFICKVHPYMTGVVAVKDSNGAIPPVPKEELPFIGHLGLDSLPAETAISVLTTLAATDADKEAKWDIFTPADEFRPVVAGVGEVWTDSQFERVPGQTDSSGSPKPGSITVVDASTFAVEREINGLDPGADGKWNNPHNMWADESLSVVYNTHWFGRTINKIDRATGAILATEQVGQAPTHVVTNPSATSPQFGVLTVPLSADKDMVKLRDNGRLQVIDHFPTGSGRNHPHGQWITADGSRIVVPNVFQGLGVTGSISVLDFETGETIREFTHAPEGLNSALLLPIAAGIAGNSKAYVSNVGTGQVSVIDLKTMELVKNIPVTFTPDGRQGGFTVFDTLQVPIQPPASPDGRFVGVAVMGLSTVASSATGSADHVAIIDTATDTAVKYLATPAGTHGANWGAKLGGGYYLYITSQHANVLTVIDADPDGDGDAADAAVVGRILLANGSPGAGVTDGTGGQGVKPLPNVYDGWVQDTLALSDTPALSAEVQGWLDSLTPAQREPGDGR